MLPADYVTPEPLPRSYLSQFCYRAGPIVDSLTLVKEKKSYRVHEVSMEAGLDGFDDDSPITFEFYEQLERCCQVNKCQVKLCPFRFHQAQVTCCHSENALERNSR